MKYAQATNVSADRSKAEIERLLARYGADQFMSGWKRDYAVISFHVQNKIVKFILPFPDRSDQAITHRRTRSGWAPRRDKMVDKVYEQEIRRRWRAFGLVIKAKLEAVESGITSFETEFMPHFVMPDGKTVAEHVLPRIEQAYQTGNVPKMLPGW